MINNMEKRGQVYILAAVIIGVLLFTIFATVNTSKQVDLNANFDRLNENYERESERFINAYVSDNNPTKELENSFPEFAWNFNKFAMETNPEFGIITTLSFTKKDGTKKNLIVNMLDTPVFVTTRFTENGGVFIPSNGETDESAIEVVTGCSEILDAVLTIPGVGTINPGETVGKQGVKFCTYPVDVAGIDKVFLFVNDIWVGYEIPKGEDPKPGLIVTAKSDEGDQTQIFINENEIPIDNSEVNKVRCSSICDLQATDEDSCRPEANKKEQKCCRVNCKIFKNKESCELQKKDEGTEYERTECCFVNNKCVNSVYDGTKFTCGSTQEGEDEE